MAKNTDFDLRIDNATLIDGNGTPGVPGSVAFRDGRIAAMGEVKGSALRAIDAQGMVVAPGFIDIHTHYDAQAFWDPTLSPSSHFGVTTVLAGNCGFSIAPLSGKSDDAEYLMRMLARVEGMPLQSLQQGVPWNWRTFEEFLARLDGTTALNIGFMVGHSALRRTVMGERAVGHQASEAEVKAMQGLLRESIRAGGLGFSSTINNSHNDAEGNPVPSRHASHDELVALAGVLREFEGTTLEFLPKIGDVFPQDQLDLLANLSTAANRPLNWNVLVPNSKRKDMYQSQLGASDYAAARGGRVVPLVSAQVNTTWVNFDSGFILDMYPGWNELFRLPRSERLRVLADPEWRRRLDSGARSDTTGTRAETSRWEQWRLAEVFHADYKRFQGQTVGEAARVLGRAPFDTMLDIVVADGLRTSLQMPMRGDDDETWRMRGEAWLDGRTIVGASDAGAHLDMIDSFTSTVRVLSDGVRQRKLLTLEQAVQQFTTVPARLVGIKERGELKVGNHADVVVFDPATVGCGPVHTRYDMPAGAGRLYADAIGVKHVFVNGREIVRDNAFQGQYPGKVLRSGRDTYTVTPGKE
ncbi:MAG TPA: amidohydrolase family protein [Burkholderiales bacterium]|nr:amidohydrolase family protein [Burkholderiales bacterium]